MYTCRFCHDEMEDHAVNRKAITELICTLCETRQPVQAKCQKCGIRFGKVSKMIKSIPVVLIKFLNILMILVLQQLFVV